MGQGFYVGDDDTSCGSSVSCYVCLGVLEVGQEAAVEYLDGHILLIPFLKANYHYIQLLINFDVDFFVPLVMVLECSWYI